MRRMRAHIASAASRDDVRAPRRKPPSNRSRSSGSRRRRVGQVTPQAVISRGGPGDRARVAVEAALGDRHGGGWRAALVVGRIHRGPRRFRHRAGRCGDHQRSRGPQPSGVRSCYGRQRPNPGHHGPRHPHGWHHCLRGCHLYRCFLWARSPDRIEYRTLCIGVAAGPWALDPAETFNISFGSAASTDNEDNTDDVLTAVFGVGQAFGAGNDNVDGTPTVGNIGRNVLTVGGFNDVGTVDSTDDVVLGHQLTWTDAGGRKKPDLTAPAGAVVAPSAMWDSPPSNPDFTAMTGTSFAAPHVAGAMTLLEGAGIGDPMAQRAILINSARDWNGASTGLIGWTPTSGRLAAGGRLGSSSTSRPRLAERSNYRARCRSGPVKPPTTGRPWRPVPRRRSPMSSGAISWAFPIRERRRSHTRSRISIFTSICADGEEKSCRRRRRVTAVEPDAIDPNDTVEQVRAPAGGPQEIIYKVEAASTIEGSGCRALRDHRRSAANRRSALPWLTRPSEVRR